MNHEQWRELLESAENSPAKGIDGIVSITVAKVLAVGIYSMHEPEIAIVKDTRGRTWIVTETHENFAELRGLVSRHDVKPGMKLLLIITKTVNGACDTKTFLLTEGAVAR